jgi:hypothetical protein
MANQPATNLIPPALEPFIEAEEAATVLRMSARYLKKLAREAKVPSHPRSDGRRRRWLFLASELHAWLLAKVNSDCGSCSERAAK